MVLLAKLNRNQTIIASSSTDQTVRIWRLQSDSTFAANQTITGSYLYLNFDGASNNIIGTQVSFFSPDRASVFGMVADCSRIDNTNGAAAVNGQCTCNYPYVWDAIKGCQIDCSRIANAQPSAPDQNSCICSDGFVWIGGSAPYCATKSPVAIIASTVSGVLALAIIGFFVTRYYRYRMQQVSAIES